MKYPLRSIIFEVTRECNLTCLYCYNPWRRTDTAPGAAIFSAANKTLTRILRDIDCQNITFTGGEPLLTDGLAELVLKCRMSGKNVTLISNGTVGTLHNYTTLCKCGVSLFELPLHAAAHDIHDQLTGVTGSHARVMASLESLRNLQADICTVFVITKINCNELLNTFTFATNFGIKRFMLARFNIGGRGIAHCEKLLPSLPELTAAFATANDFAKAHPTITISANVCLPRCIISPADYRNIYIAACSPSTDRRPVTIDYEGNVRICNHSPVTFGNIHKESMESLFASSYCVEWRTAQPPYCTDCAMWEKCGGGCRAASEQLGRSLYNEDPAIGMWKKSVA